MSEESSLDKRLQAVLAAHYASICQSCGRKLDRGDLAWQNGMTEYGTDFSSVYIICQACDTEAIRVGSWGIADSLADAIAILETDWRDE